MATYLGSKKITTIYNITAPVALDKYFNRNATRYTEEDLAGLQDLKRSAFYYHESLTSVTFPNTLKSIGDTPFLGCSKLSYVRFTSIEPPALGDRPFPTNTTFTSIYVPKGCSEKYKAAYGFSDYASKIKEW